MKITGYSYASYNQLFFIFQYKIQVIPYLLNFLIFGNNNFQILSYHIRTGS